MADRIKGITVEIGGETTGLKKALQGVDKEIRNTQQQLKDVERLLKLDPGNTELLAQKQRLLAQAVSETSGRLDSLKQAERQVQEQFQRGEVSQQQYDALQREIVETEQRLRELERAAQESVSTMARIGDTAGKVGDGAGKIASGMAPVSAGIAAAGVAAVKAMDNVDEGLDTVMKKTGATGEEAKSLQTVYNNVATTVPAAFADIGASVGEVNTRLGFTDEKLQAASTQFLKFAQVNDTDVNTSVQLVTRAMGDAGIAADDYSMVLDSLTVAGQKSGISVDKLSENLAKYGAPLRALGVDTQEAIAMFAGWEKAGVNTEIAFSGMKKAISNWGASGKDASVEFGKTLQAIKDCPDIASATSMAIDTFGAKAGPDLADAIRGGRFEVDEYIGALQNAGGAVDSTYGMIVDEVDDSALALQTLQVAAHDMGETIAKTVGPFLLEAAQAVQSLFERFGALDPGMQQVILTVLALVAAIAPVAKIVQGIMVVVATVTTVISTVSGAIAIFTGAAATGAAASTALAGALTFITGPAGLIIAAIAAVVAIIVVLWNNCEEFRSAVTKAWTLIQEAFQAFLQWLQATFAPVWNAVVGAMQTIFATFKEAIGIAWEGITSIFSLFGTFLQDNFGVTWSKVFDTVKTVLSVAGAFIQTTIHAVTGIFSGIITFLTTVFLAGWKGGFDNLVNFIRAFQDTVTQVIDGIKKVFGGIVDFVTGVFTGDWGRAWEGVKGIFQGVFEALVGIAKAPINAVIGLLNTAINAINSLIAGVNKLLDGVRSLGVGIPAIPSIPNIAYLAKGGILEQGTAMVGENGPELLSLMNGKAKVTPLSSTEGSGGSRDTRAATAGFSQTIIFNTRKMTPADVARQTRTATRTLLAGVKA